MTETALASPEAAQRVLRDPNQRPAFTANMQYGAKDNQPHFKGTIRAPESDVNESLALWSGTYTDKDGSTLVFFTGNTGFIEGLSAMEQIHARAAPKAPALTIGGKDGNKPMTLEDGRVVMFEAKHPDGNIASNGNRRTDVYGYWNRGGVLIEVGAYANAQDGRMASLVGNTQLPFNKDKIGEPSREQMSQQEIDDMLARSGPEDGPDVPDPRPRKRRRDHGMDR